MGEQFFYQKNLIRIFFSVKDENLWLEKTGAPHLEKYVLEADDLGAFDGKIKKGIGIGEVQQSAQIDMPLLLKKSKAYFLNKKIIDVELFDYQQVKFDKAFVFYKNIKAKKIIFCEGQQGRNNPWFTHLPFEVAKGEVLLVKIPDANFDKMLKHKLFIIPLPDGLYWIGSTYDWDTPDDLPTEKAKAALIEKLHKVLTIPFEVIDHQAAIRPTTYDRRPFVGLHPENECLAIVNGMGTKGASLAPYFVNEFVEFLLEGKMINEEADALRKFKKVQT